MGQACRLQVDCIYYPLWWNGASQRRLPTLFHLLNHDSLPPQSIVPPKLVWKAFGGLYTKQCGVCYRNSALPVVSVGADDGIHIEHAVFGAVAVCDLEAR